MTNYKITNLTDTVGKRDTRFNTTLNIEYVDDMQKKSIQIKPGETVFLQIRSLPLSVHRLRVKKLISVVEVSNNELKSTMKVSRPVVAQKSPETAEETEKRVATASKKKVKKSHEEEVSES